MWPAAFLHIFLCKRRCALAEGLRTRSDLNFACRIRQTQSSPPSPSLTDLPFSPITILSQVDSFITAKVSMISFSSSSSDQMSRLEFAFHWKKSRSLCSFSPRALFASTSYHAAKPTLERAMLHALKDSHIFEAPASLLDFSFIRSLAPASAHFCGAMASMNGISVAAKCKSVTVS